MSNLDEWQLIAALNSAAQRYDPAIALASGDDCALWSSTADDFNAISTDTLNAGIHFPADLDPAAVAYRALMVNLSDLAAMGAQPLAYLNALSLPDPEIAPALRTGFAAAEQEFKLSLIGGNIARAPALSLSITIIGRVPRTQVLRRDGGRCGDDLYLSGELGGAALGLQITLEHGLLAPATNPAERELEYWQQRYLRPRPRLRLATRLRAYANCCIDVSDGLYSDLGHLLRASQLGATIDPASIAIAQPRHNHQLSLSREQALTHGDDYELLFSAPPKYRAQIQHLAQELSLPIQRIGELNSHPAGTIIQDGKIPNATGYRHF